MIFWRCCVNKPNKIIVHCAQTPNYSEKYGLKDIEKWHKARGFLDPVSKIACGYHLIICCNGSLEIGRPLTSIGAHTKYMNYNSIGICLMGTDQFTYAQVNFLNDVATFLRKKYSIPKSRVFGHYEFDKFKTCPNINMKHFRRMLDDTK